MVTVSTVPDVLLTGLFIKQSLIEISFAQKEFDGTAYITGIWRAFIDIARTGSLADASPTVDASDAAFNATESAKAYRNATSVADKLDAGKSLIGAVADGSNLTLDPDLDSFYAMDAATVRLPGMVTAAVALGRAAADPVSDPARLVHIAFAVNRLEISAGDADASLSAAMKNNESGLTREALSGLTSKLRAAAGAVTSRGHDLLEGRPAVDLPVAQAALIAALDAAGIATDVELDRLLVTRMHGFYRKLAVSLAIAGASLIAAAWLSRVISTGLSRRVRGLVAVMDRLIADDVTAVVPYVGDSNETGRIAKTLEAFKTSVIERNKLKSQSAYAEEQTRVVESLARGLDQLAKGDLTVTLDQIFPPQLEKIRTDFDATVSTLRQTMQTITASANTIRFGTSEIATATGDLARRTELQVSMLTASTTALDQLAASIGRSSDDAMSARETVSAAKLEAEQSEGVVREAISAMNGIESSSQRIREIVSFIDEIASQTNLLALNAAIEAARAGDSGRGFAVVAAEVRELAQHSTQSAKQIRNLIALATKQIGTGANLVDATGKALERIVAHVGGTNDAIGDIAHVAAIQSSKLRETNEAFAHMNRVTQQNIDMVEGVTGAARSLSHETERLARLVGAFTIDAPPADPARRAA